MWQGWTYALTDAATSIISHYLLCLLRTTRAPGQQHLEDHLCPNTSIQVKSEEVVFHMCDSKFFIVCRLLQRVDQQHEKVDQQHEKIFSPCLEYSVLLIFGLMKGSAGHATNTYNVKKKTFDHPDFCLSIYTFALHILQTSIPPKTSELALHLEL